MHPEDMPTASYIWDSIANFNLSVLSSRLI